VNDRINERLKSALSPDESGPATLGVVGATGPSTDVSDDNSPESQVVTTMEELEGYYIVKSIVRDVVDPQRVFIRDTLSYCGVLLDDNNRKPICRMFLNSAGHKYLGVFDSEKKITRYAIKDINDIYNFGDILRATASGYDNESKPSQIEGDSDS
jgi:hypothetical protein